MLVLASQSPRRRELLTLAGLDFIVRAAPVEEIPQAGESPIDYVRRLSQAKAHAVNVHPGETILAADTIVVCDGLILEKPRDSWEAAAMLRTLSGRVHQVITGLCLRTTDTVRQDHESTLVWFRHLSEAEIKEYIATGEPMDKAGAYGIQGRASKFIPRVEGCFFNVVGLPLAKVYALLSA
jgi:septum formation protein